MSEKRIMLELGSGADLHGGDCAKAARRAIEDALRRSSLTILKSLNLDPHAMRIEANIAVPDPESVDREALAAALPYGTVEVILRKGGLSAAGLGAEGGSNAVLAAAALAVHIDIPEGRWALV